MSSGRSIFHPIRQPALLALLLLFISCKKETLQPPAPPPPDYPVTHGCSSEYGSVTGFLYAHTLKTLLWFSPPKYTWKENSLAIFSDPPANLCSSIDPLSNQATVWTKAGNLNTGKVSMNDFPLNWSTGVGYYSHSPATAHPPDTAITWSIQGNSAIPAFTEHFEQAFPRPNPTRTPVVWLSKTNQYKFEASDFFLEYDSVWVIIPNHGAQRMRPGTTYVQFTPMQMENYVHNYDSVAIQVKAHRYFHARRAGKYYQYLFVTAIPVTAFISNQ